MIEIGHRVSRPGDPVFLVDMQQGQGQALFDNVTASYNAQHIFPVRCRQRVNLLQDVVQSCS